MKKKKKNIVPSDEVNSAPKNQDVPPDEITGSTNLLEGKLPINLNNELANIIPVVYGALLSYAMYIFAQMVISFSSDFQKAENYQLKFNYVQEFGLLSLLYLPIFLFLVEDMGEIVKIGKSFPFRKPSRYASEIMVTFGFLSSFALISVKNCLSILTFAIALGFGGVWCNQLKQEYKSDCSGIDCVATTQRDLQLAGSFIFTFECVYFLITSNTIKLTTNAILTFCVTFIIWKFFYELYLRNRHSETIEEYSVNLLIPNFLLRKGKVISPPAD